MSDRRRLKAYGAHALYIEGLSIRTETVAAVRGHRPWAPDRVIVEMAGPLSPGPARDDDDAAEASGRRVDDPER